FFGQKASYGMIPFLTIGALIGCLTIIYVVAQRQQTFGRPGRVCSFLASAAVFIQLGIMLSYYWGNLGHRYAYRFGIIYVPVIIILNLFLVNLLDTSKWRTRILVAVACLGILIYYRPVAGMNASAQGMLIYREFQQVRTFLEHRYPQQNILLISHRPSLFTPFRWGAISTDFARLHADQIQQRWQKGSFRDIVIHQCIRHRDGLIVDPDTDQQIQLTSTATASSSATSLYAKTELLSVTELSEDYQLRLLRVCPP
ncbi:MAG TPA: hypothetical protein PKO06_24355, partial [Candidatus Ozemobacteraceae bacterium]|nr:hypothetical protein [Candidatus Ozemobacteraceae bacterium]